MEKEIKLISYNIDGLPETLDLADLPWILKPIAWIYKLIKGTTIIRINDNCDTEKHINHISECLKKSDADIIGVQEDFNYHDNLISSLKDRYSISTYQGGFDLSKIFTNTEWLSFFPFPRFKCDGLNLLTKDDKVCVNDEDIMTWDKSYGYFNHANDLLTHKGFRFYPLTIGNSINIDVYILHMDADFYNPNTCPNVDGDIEARKNQLSQLSRYILDRYERGNKRPIIIMGDTNCSVNYQWDNDNINEYLIKPISSVLSMTIEEIIPSNRRDVDRIFVINDLMCKYHLEASECFYDESFNQEIGRVSDHMPLVTTIKILNK